MRSIRKVVASILVGGACLTGLTACGGSDKISDASFLTKCKKAVDKNATLKAYSADICSCTQQKLKAQGLGGKSQNDKALKDEVTTATADCVRQAIAS